MNIIKSILTYIVLGTIFSLFFNFKGIKKIDPLAINSTLGFKVIILPGTILFWPYLLYRYLKHPQLPEEQNAHRVLSKKETTPS